MSESEKAKCEVCGATADDFIDIEIYHRGCRFKAMLPNAYEERGGLLFFDGKEIGEALGKAISTAEEGGEGSD